MRKPRVLIVTNMVPPYRIPLFNYLARDGGIELRVLALAATEANRQWRIDETRLGFAYRILPGVHRHLARSDRMIHLNWGLGREVRRFRPDVVITSGYDSLDYWKAWLYSRILGSRFILWSGTTLLSTATIGGFVGGLKRWIIKRADRYVTYGTGAAEYLLHMKAQAAYVHVGLNAVDVEWFKERADEARCDEFHQPLLTAYLTKRISEGQILRLPASQCQKTLQSSQRAIPGERL